MSRLRWELVPADEILVEREPVPYCTHCGGEGTIPADPIFVNTAHNYGVEYRAEDPCPVCGEAQGEPDA